jgi:hypothetical protein
LNSSRKQTIINIDKNVRGKEPSYTIGGNVITTTVEMSMEVPQKN